MNPVVYTHHHHAIVYDADRIQQISREWLSPEHWLQAGAVCDRAPGRGQALMLKTEWGDAVLRRYFRGGLPARWLRDGYLFLGRQRSRPFREFELLRQMSAMDLPVPQPWAASCERHGMVYRGGLLMSRIADAVPLSTCLTTADAQSWVWPGVGRCIRRFHNAGVWHADLNAANILLRASSEEVFLIDFDRGRLRERPVDGQANLARLQRSLRKLWPAEAAPLATCWQALSDAYAEAGVRS